MSVTRKRWMACLAGMGLGGWLGGMCAFGQNLVADGGFEAADAARADEPAGFVRGYVGRKRQARLTWEAPGRQSARCVAVETLESNDLAYWQTTVAVKPQTRYTISFWYKTNPGVAGGATGGDPLYNQGRAGGPNLELGVVPDDPAHGVKPNDWTDIGLSMPPLGGLFLPVATEWSQFRHTVTTLPGQTKMCVKLRLWCYAQKVWFDDLSVTEGAVEAEAPKADALWKHQDTTPPAVIDPRPLPNTSATPDAVICAAFRENGSGVDPTSARILLDGRDVTSEAKVTPEGVTFKPTAGLGSGGGAHRVMVSVSDRAGNRSNVLTWQFGVGRTLKNQLDHRKSPLQLNGQPFFPIGLYAYACHPGDGRFRADHLTSATAAGFNFILNTIETEAGLDREAVAGIMGALNITSDLKGCADPPAARKALLEKGQGRFKDHPCVLGYWADDPENLDNTEASPTPTSTIQKIRNARMVVNEADPGRPWVFAISNLPRLAECAALGDILLAYRYPVPRYHPQMIHGYTLAYVFSVVKDKPVWFNSQALDLGYGRQFKSTEKMRPTAAEIRAMAFLSLALGVKGYAMYANYLNEKDYPEEWAEALRIATRMRYLAPALAAGQVDNAAVKLAEDVSSASIYYRPLRYEGTYTLIAVNMSAGTVVTRWEFAQPAAVRVLFEDRATSQPTIELRDVFEPWGAHLYEWNSP